MMIATAVVVVEPQEAEDVAVRQVLPFLRSRPRPRPRPRRASRSRRALQPRCCVAGRTRTTSAAAPPTLILELTRDGAPQRQPAATGTKTGRVRRARVCGFIAIRIRRAQWPIEIGAWVHWRVIPLYPAHYERGMRLSLCRSPGLTCIGTLEVSVGCHCRCLLVENECMLLFQSW